MPTIAVVTDLIFGTKITGTGKALGKPVLVARTLEKLQEHLDAVPADAGAPTLIIDLNANGIDPIVAVRLARAHKASPNIIAYLSHVQVDLAQAAREAGAHQAMARSAFVQQLPNILAPTVP